VADQTIRIGGWSLRGLACKFPAKVPPSVQQAFNETLDALRLDRTKYRIVYVPSRAIRFAERNPRDRGIVDFMLACSKSYKVRIGSIGQCAGRTAFVVQSAENSRADERSTAIHEALHFVFGPHPWKGEKS